MGGASCKEFLLQTHRFSRCKFFCFGQKIPAKCAPDFSSEPAMRCGANQEDPPRCMYVIST
jgi:hypothetical protein